MTVSKSYAIDSNEEVESLSEIRWDVYSESGLQKSQHLGKWLVDSRGGWYLVLAAYRPRAKHLQWGAPKFNLSRWKKEGAYFRRHANINLRPEVLQVFGCGGLADEAVRHVSSVTSRLGTDALENCVLECVGDDL